VETRYTPGIVSNWTKLSLRAILSSVPKTIIPLAAMVRDDPDGSRWQTAEVALAPLAPGDYVVELASGTTRSLAAFRLVP